MAIPIAIISILFSTLVCHNEHLPVDDNCITRIDSLTKMTVYTTVDILAKNEGGEVVLRKRLEREVAVDTIKNNNDINVIVAFIVDVDGSIKGERILVDGTNRIGLKMLKIIKSFKWLPAICNGSSVPSLQELKAIIDPSQE